MTKKGFTLLEILIAALVLTVIGTGMVSVYVLQGALLRESSHRLEAVNYARSCSAKLMSISGGTVNPWFASGALKDGQHTEITDPGVCALPDTYFKQSLNGKIEYYIEKVPQITEGSTDMGFLRAKITVKWTEKLLKSQNKEESIYAIICAYVQEPPMFIIDEDGTVFMGGVDLIKPLTRLASLKMKNRMRHKKGFTLIEFIVAGIIFSALGAAAGNLYYLHGKVMKAAIESSQKDLNSQFALVHLTENINNSAWIVVKSPNQIELHSHSNPALREYTFDNGRLTFRSGGNISTIATGLASTNFFTGKGTERPNNTFSQVLLEFWTKGPQASSHLTQDIFYTGTVAASKEDWSIVFVDPAHGSSYQDGSKIFPFLDLQTTLESVGEGVTVLVKSGEHTLSGELEIRCDYLCTGPGTKLTIAPGAILKVIEYAAIYVEGEFYCAGTPNARIKLTSLHPELYTQYVAWSGIFLSPKAVDGNIQSSFNISYIDISYCSTGIYFLSSQYDATISNNYAYNIGFGGTFNLGDVANLQMYNNTFVSCLRPFYIESLPKSGTENHLSIYSNTFTGSSRSYLRQIPDESSSVYTDIYNNNFTGPGESLSINAWDCGGLAEQKIYNNIFKSSGSLFIQSLNRNPSSQILLKNNTFDGGGKVFASIYILRNLTKVVIANNDIGYGTIGESYMVELSGGGPVEFRNNIIHDNPGALSRGVLVRATMDWCPSNVIFRNNIMYKTGGFVYSNSGWYRNDIQSIRLENNTLVDGARIQCESEGLPPWTIKNTITTGLFLRNMLLPITSYSYCGALPSSVDPNAHMIATPPVIDPVTKATTNSPYLDGGILLDDSGNPILDSGGNPQKTAVGAYGGLGAAGWSDGVGAKGKIGADAG